MACAAGLAGSKVLWQHCFLQLDDTLGDFKSDGPGVVRSWGRSGISNLLGSGHELVGDGSRSRSSSLVADGFSSGGGHRVVDWLRSRSRRGREAVADGLGSWGRVDVDWFRSRSRHVVAHWGRGRGRSSGRGKGVGHRSWGRSRSSLVDDRLRSYN